MECENHSGERAVGRCLVCGKPVCGDCAVNWQGKLFCDNAEHPQLHATWKTVATCKSEFESDLIQRNLLDHQIPCLVFPLHRHAGFFGLQVEHEVRVTVAAPLAGSASDVLESLSLVSESDSEGFAASGGQD